MTKEELISKLSDLEWEDFEVKEAKGEVPKSAWETVSSFSNTAGGWLIFGVKQSKGTFTVIKISNPEKVEQDFLGVLRSGQKFNTIINPTCARYEFNGKTVLAFYIPVSPNKPVYYNTQVNTFIRRGSADQKATQAEIDAMFRDQKFGTKTSEFAIKTSLSDLKEKSIREYRDYMSRFNPGVSYNRMDLDDFLLKMRILDRETKQCTFAGLLFFGKRDTIEDFFTDFRIDLLEIPGISYTEASSRYTYRISEDDYENLWEAYFECFKRLRKEVDVEFKITGEGFGEELSSGLLSVREALVNMLIHADYFAPACPRIRIFTNHIEYFNPGGLPKPLEDLKGNDLSIPRNPILAKLFRMVKLAENAGYGFDKIDDNWKFYNNTIPEYIIDVDTVIVKLTTRTEEISNVKFEKNTFTIEKIKQDFGSLTYRLSISSIENLEYLRGIYGVFTGYLRGIYEVDIKAFEQESNEKGLFIVLLVDMYPSITKNEMATILGCSLSTIEKSMQKIRKHININRQGSDKTGKWILISNKNQK